LTVAVADAAAYARGFGLAVEATGHDEGFATTLGLTRAQGTIVLKSTFHGKGSLDTARIVVDEIKIIGSRCGRLSAALDLLSRKAVDVGSLVSERRPLSEAVGALDLAARPGILKVLLER
jgi:threonine dehydrogenase-like Zn-dependent dehydrogenase